MVVTSEVVDARRGSEGGEPGKRVQVLDLGGCLLYTSCVTAGGSLRSDVAISG